MTVVNASTATERFRLTPVSNQVAFSSQDPGGVNTDDTEYSWLTTGGDDVQVTGTGIDVLGSPPTSGIADIIEIDLSDNLFTQPDVEISFITGQTGGGAVTGADMAVITLGALDFFNELMSFDDVMIGSDFDDIFNGGGGADELTMGDGEDEAFGGVGADVINGGDDDDTLNGEGNNDTLNGGEGDDRLNGGLGADDMDGGENNDTYIVDNAGDTAAEGVSGIDLVEASVSHELSDNIENLSLTGVGAIDGTGNALDNVILGNTGDNTLLGRGGIDTLSGNFGRDTLDGGTGADDMDGGFGNDTYVVDNTGDVAAEAAGGTDLVLSSVTHTLSAGLENLTLTGAAPSIGNGNGLGNIIIGNGANNIMSGLGGRDTLDGGAGADTMLGGGNNDTYFVDDAGDVITEFAGGGTDLVNSSVTKTLDPNVENLTLTGTADIDGTGNGGGNVITGNSGVNLLSGGGSGDTLVGGGGLDTLTGDGGNDVFKFNAVSDSGPASAQADFIIGFDNPGAVFGDVIDLATIDAIDGVAGSVFTFLGVIQTPFPPTTTVAGDLWLRNEGGNTVVYGNIDGDDATEFAIRISDGGVAPADYSAADFIL